MNRPLVWVAAGLAAGIFTGAMGAGHAVWLLALTGAAMCVAGILRFQGREAVVMLLLFAAAGQCLWLLWEPGLRDDPLSRQVRHSPETRYAIKGRVVETSLYLPSDDYSRFVVDADRATPLSGDNPQPLRGRILVQCRDPLFPVHPGQRLAFAATLDGRLGEINHDVYGYEDYLRGRGVHTRAQTAGKDIVRGNVQWWSPMYWASRLRTYEAAILEKTVPARALSLTLALWLGEQRVLSKADRDAYTASGTVHILSVGGIHVSIIYGTVSVVLRMLLAHRRRRIALTLAIVLLFTLATGAQAPSIRAAVMFALYMAAEFFDRESDAPTAISVAAIGFLLLRPPVLFEQGFLLSFASVASILIFTPRIETLFEETFPHWFSSALGVSLGVQFIPFPIAMHFFHVAALLGLFANMIVVPLTGASLWLAFLTTVAGACYTPAGHLFGASLALCCDGIVHCARLFAALPMSHRLIVSPTPWGAVLFWSAAAALFFAMTQAAYRRRLLAMSIVLFAASWIFWRPFSPPAEVHFLDVGRGDSAFLRTPGGTTVLIDGGNLSDRTDMGERVVVPFLLGHGVSRPDYVAVSHADSDHLGGLFAVIETLGAGEVLLGPSDGKAVLENEFIALCDRKHVHIRHLVQGEIIALNDGALEVLYPPRDGETLDENNRSLVLRYTWDGPSVLFTGDIERKGEASLTKTDCSAVVLKVPHHGSNTSSTTPFIAAVHPRYAVISTLATGRLRAVGDGVLERYEQQGVPVMRTDLEGGIRLRRDGIHLGARKAKGY